MAHPRVFVSSTYYDLKHLRSSLENFIESLGYDPILSEKGEIAYAPDTPLDESCYREVRNADIFVIIIGGRYGSEKSETKTKLPKHFFDRYDSITKQEYKSAAEQDLPIYILIEKSVYSEFETFIRNKENQTITYAHVDSVNIFHLIEDILAQPRNNPVHQFDRYSEIQRWLKEQWSGLFRELLNRLTSQQQISSLASQVSELAEINKTLKTYLEEVVSKIAPDESAKLIQTESKRLAEARQISRIENSTIVRFINRVGQIPFEKIYALLKKAKSVEEFINAVGLEAKDTDFSLRLSDLYARHREAVITDIDEVRDLIGLSGLQPEDVGERKSVVIPPKRKPVKTKPLVKRASKSSKKK